VCGIIVAPDPRQPRRPERRPTAATERLDSRVLASSQTELDDTPRDCCGNSGHHILLWLNLN
jgi:hypothetical protein